MPRYDVRCRTCGSTFEVTRSMAHADDPAPCPEGHDDTVRLLSMVSVMSSARSGSGGPSRSGQSAPPASSAGGGCCGGGCCG